MSDLQHAAPEISVIIPVYNGDRYIGEAVDSILSQTYSDYEIIVVDDGSIDNTRQVIEQYGNKIKYFSQINQKFRFFKQWIPP